MRRPLLLATLLCAAPLLGCAVPQQASSPQCEEFARSGGYPFLTGGPINGPSSTLEQLPGAPPLWLGGPGEPSVVAHLDEESYLLSWCLTHLQ